MDLCQYQFVDAFEAVYVQSWQASCLQQFQAWAECTFTPTINFRVKFVHALHMYISVFIYGMCS